MLDLLLGLWLLFDERKMDERGIQEKEQTTTRTILNRKGWHSIILQVVVDGREE